MRTALERKTHDGARSAGIASTKMPHTVATMGSILRLEAGEESVACMVRVNGGSCGLA